MQTDDAREQRKPEPHPSEQPSRKPYRAPQLADLGTITEITQSVAGQPEDGGPQGFQGSQGM